MIGISFITNSVLLGVGLAMDAFSVSIANGLSERGMRPGRMATIAGVYAFFQFLMPMIGWGCVHTVETLFVSFQKWIPWIALILLLYIGLNMIREGLQEMKQSPDNRDASDGEHPIATGNAAARIGWKRLLVQGIATSIDALSVGFTIAQYGPGAAFLASTIIAAVTFAICMGGLVFGKKLGDVLSSKAQIFGGCILIFIGVRIFLQR